MKRSHVLWLVFPAVILRGLRIWAPNVQIEDPNYIYGGFLMSRGMAPFLDFAQPNPPLLESILSVFYRVFGVSYRIPELCTAAVYVLTAVLLYMLGKKWFSSRAGMVAAVLYSVHYLLFRYHLFEREIYATAAVLAGLVIAWRDDQRRFVSGFLGGLAMGLGYACKQTALVQVAPVIAVTAVFLKDWRRSAGIATGFAGMTGGLTLAYMGVFGDAYLRQTFWFHFIKGAVAPWWIKAGWTAAGLGFLLIPVAAAIPLLMRVRHPIWIPVGMAAADIVFFWFISGAFWPHYLLSTLAPLSLLAGAAVRPGFKRTCRIATLQWITAGLAALGFLITNPFLLIGKGAVTQYGFSGIPREAVSECARHIRSNTTPDDLIISDPFVALEARRIKVVRFRDNWGLILWMNRMIDEGRYRDAVDELSQLPFGDVRKWSQRFWMPMIQTAFTSGRVGAVIPNYELPLPDNRLRELGYQRSFQNRFYTVWTRSPSVLVSQTGK